MRLWPMLLAAVICLEPACHQAQQVETKPSDEAKSEQPGLFTVPQDQLARLKTTQVRSTNWPVAVHTTGTVDWDADHTTQAITQVNGPISRILVDLGTPVKKDEPLLYVSSPDVANAIATYRKARNREAFNKRIVDRMKELLDRGAIAVKDYESSEADYNDATTDVQNSLQALRIFGITAQEIDEAEKQGTAVNTELAVRSPISGVIVQKLVSPGQVIQAGQTVCFTISDVSTVWVQGHIFDRDLPSVKSGDPVEETNPSFNRQFPRHGVLHRDLRRSEHAHDAGPHRDAESRRAAEEGHVRGRGDPHRSTQPHAGGAGGGGAARRQERADGLRAGGAGQVRAAQRDHRGPAGRAGGDHRAGLQEGETVVSDGSLFLQFANTIK